eukprot:1638349-Rhodomonas_salina.2
MPMCVGTMSALAYCSVLVIVCGRSRARTGRCRVLTRIGRSRARTGRYRSGFGADFRSANTSVVRHVWSAVRLRGSLLRH